MNQLVLHDESYHRIGRYKRLVVEASADRDAGEYDPALNHVLSFASRSTMSPAVFESGVEGDHRGFHFTVRLGEPGNNTIHVTIS